MKVQEGFIYLDECNRKDGVSFSVALDTINKNIIYSNDCINFLEDIKSIVSRVNVSRLVDLSIFECKGNFENCICRGILGLKVVGCILDTIYYEVPSTLSEDILSEVYNYSKVEEMVVSSLGVCVCL